MKTKLLFRFLLFPFAFLLSPCTAQVPQGFNYQAIARNGSGLPITNQAIPVRISIVTALTGGTVIWQEEHSTVTADQYGLISLVVGTGTKTGGSAASFAAIDWSAQTLYLKTEVKYPGPDWTEMGTSQIWAVPYSLVAKNIAPLSKLGITGTTSDMEEALFEVKNKVGQTVFAVYNEGIRAYVGNGDAKGKRGGFSVGGYDATKGTTIYDLLTLNTDSARIYVDSKPNLKGVRGGFSVGGYDMTKDGIPVQNYLEVSKDSVRIYIDSNPLTKGKKGGFAVGGYDMTKGTNDNYLNVNTDATGIIKPVNRILWYPIKNAFLAGNIRIGTPDSVGVNSFATGYRSKSRGMYSQAMGFKAIANGDYSTAIGKNAVANNINSFAFGEGALANNSESYAIGKGAVASGYRSFAFGSAGVDTSGNVTDVARASGDYSFAIGQGSQASGKGAVAIGLANIAQGNYSVALGYKVNASGRESTSFGFGNIASGIYSTSFGYFNTASGIWSTSMGDNTTASGQESITMGSGTVASGTNSTAMGVSTKATGGQSTAMGMNTTASGSYSTAIGFGATASYSCSIALGYNTASGGYASTSMGSYTTATSDYSTAMGVQTKASGGGSTSMGSNTKAKGGASTAMGDRTTASGGGSTSMGGVTTASGDYSTAMGIFTIAKPLASVALGQGNDTTCSVNGKNTWVSTDPLFIIGNGTYAATSNALTVLKNGCVGLQSVISPTYALQLPNSATIGVGAARAYAWTTYSDSRLKENQVPLSYGLREVMELSPKQYVHHSSIDQSTWPEENIPRTIGLIAQEVYNIIPEAVDVPENSATGLWGLNYDKLVPVLVKAIQEQQSQIESSKQENHKLQSEIDELKILVDKLITNQTAQANGFPAN